MKKKTKIIKLWRPGCIKYYQRKVAWFIPMQGVYSLSSIRHYAILKSFSAQWNFSIFRYKQEKYEGINRLVNYNYNEALIAE